MQNIISPISSNFSLTFFFLVSTATKNFQANRLNVMNIMNATNVQRHVNIYALVVSGKDHVTKVYKSITKKFFFFTENKISPKLATEHQVNCLHPKKSGAEVMQALEATDATQSEDKKLFATLIELLSYEKIIFNGKYIEKIYVINRALNLKLINLGSMGVINLYPYPFQK